MSHTKQTGKNTNTHRSGGDSRRKGQQQDQMYRGAFMVPVSKDWVFRQRTKKDGSPGSQTELRENHPDVTRIWVDRRENSKSSEQGDLLKVEITGPTKEVVDACYAEGRQKILDSMDYDRKKAQSKQENKQRYHERRHRQAQERLLRANGGGSYSDEIQSGDSAMMQSFKMAMQKRKAQAGDGAAEDKGPSVAQLKSGNAFGALLDDEDDAFAEAQARRNQGKARRERKDRQQAQAKQAQAKQSQAKSQSVADMFADAPALPSAPRAVREAPKVSSGWAKMAAKPKQVEVVKEPEPMVRFAVLPKKTTGVSKTVERSLSEWDREDEQSGWGSTVQSGGWDDWD